MKMRVKVRSQKLEATEKRKVWTVLLTRKGI